MNFRSYLIKLSTLTLLLALVIAGVNSFVPFFQSFKLFTWLALLFFASLALLTGYIGLKGIEKSPHGFVANVNGIVMLKLFLSVGLVVGYLLIAKPESKAFISSFFFLYIVYTVFEILQFVVAQKKNIMDRKRSEHGAK